jgi:hypothetical protein
LQLAEGNILSSRLIIDSMGNFSPVVKQVWFPFSFTIDVHLYNHLKHYWLD